MPEAQTEYLNDDSRCPGLFAPSHGTDDFERCQYAFSSNTVCGLPRYNNAPDGSPRCICHYEGERDADELRQQLEAMVNSGACLWDAQLSGVRLVGADLAGAWLMDADLSDALLADANLSGADLTDADLTDIDLKFANLKDADLTDARIEGRADLRRANFTDAVLTGTHIASDCRLAHTIWTDHPECVMRAERDAINALAEGANHKAFNLYVNADIVYRQIKQGYHNAGDPQTASRFFIREMECRRAQLSIDTPESPRGPVWERAFWWLMRHTCAYGEWPGRIAVIGAGLVLIFAIIQGYFCGFADTRVRHVQVGPGIDWTPDIAGVHNFLSALYFSMITFTGLGYGDTYPVSAAGRVVASAEVALGLVITSLFLVTIVRKWSR